MPSVKNLAIIPARGGSKRIPNKNIVDFFGKPLIVHTIEAALKSKLFKRIFVSTDSQVIADIAKDFGLDVPFLRDSHYNDNSSVHKATLSSTYKIENFYTEKYDNIVQLMPNCPLRNEIQIIKAFENFIVKDTCFQISVNKFGWMNPWWAMRINKQNKTMKLFPEAFMKRSQDLDELFCPTGAIWIAKIDEFKKARTFYGPNFKLFPIDWKFAIDIDEEADLEMAKCIFTYLNKF